MSGPLETAREHWGAALPDWVEVLALECGRSSANKVAELLDRSPAVISQVLRNKYTADTSRFEERVRGVFLDANVACPDTGEALAGSGVAASGRCPSAASRPLVGSRPIQPAPGR
jgi:hypothetical protein